VDLGNRFGWGSGPSITTGIYETFMEACPLIQLDYKAKQNWKENTYLRWAKTFISPNFETNSNRCYGSMITDPLDLSVGCAKLVEGSLAVMQPCARVQRCKSICPNRLNHSWPKTALGTTTNFVWKPQTIKITDLRSVVTHLAMVMQLSTIIMNIINNRFVPSDYIVH
jgi:hypothetical protein